ncbi:MAG: alpha-1,2-fucosyltransferase [Puniceicoccales bacterium]|nr:alpha-1,2-fucosyltransferase [Puniceicoccales bacterium]
MFSDDIGWARENLKFDHPCVFVDINDEDSGWKDFVLMKNCRHHIINFDSSFSTYAAILSKKDGKIVVGHGNDLAANCEKSVL